VHREVKEQAIQAGLRHARELEEAQAAADAKLAESLEEYTNNTAVLRAELEEESKARKAAEHRIELMTTDHREYDRLVMQIDALALSKPLSCPFFRLQAFSFW
jgi:t-SNARE complex subunit (syntaxin)